MGGNTNNVQMDHAVTRELLWSAVMNARENRQKSKISLDLLLEEISDLTPPFGLAANIERAVLARALDLENYVKAICQFSDYIVQQGL
jgi:hypothetical protein